MTDFDMEIFCDYCGKRIEEDEMDDRIWEHEASCPRHHDPELNFSCKCDIELHVYCLPGWMQKGLINE